MEQDVIIKAYKTFICMYNNLRLRFMGKKHVLLVYAICIFQFLSAQKFIFPFENGNKFGLKDQNGKVLLEAKYDWIDDQFWLNNQPNYIPITVCNGYKNIEYNYPNGGKWGIINKDGQEITPLKYDEINLFNKDGLAVVKLNNKYGVISQEGKEIIPITYNEVVLLGEGIIKVKLNDKWGLINKASVKTVLKYDHIYSLLSGMIVYEINNKYGFLNMSLKEVIPPKYDYIGDRAAVSFWGDYAIISLDSKYGIINKKGVQILPLKYDFTYISNNVIYGLLNKKLWIFDKTGKAVKQLNYDFEERDFPEFYDNDDLAKVSKNKKYGFISKTGKEEIPCKYEEVSLFNEGLAPAKLDDKYGIIDTKGKAVIPFKFSGFSSQFSEGLIGILINGKWGFMDKTGKIVIKRKYDYVNDFKNGYSIVKLDNKYGVIDTTDREIVPIIYNEITSIEEINETSFVENRGFWRVQTLDYQQGIVNKEGKLVIPIGKYYISKYFKGQAVVNKENKAKIYLYDK